MISSTLHGDLEASALVPQHTLESHFNAEQLAVWFSLVAHLGAAPQQLRSM
jgi:hypothetical protein